MQIVNSQVPEIAVEFHGPPHVCLAHHGQNVELDPFALEQPERIHYGIPRAVPRFVQSVRVVNVFGTVERNSNQKMVRAEQSTPLGGEQRSIGLNGVGNGLAAASETLLKFDE